MSGALDGNLTFSDLSGARGGGSYPNPMFDFLTGFAPRKLKDLFRWVEYLYYNSAHIFAALKKFAEYPVTDISIDSNDEVLKDNWERVLKKSVKAKNVAIYSGLDLHLYGNSFISVYQPFNRFLICKACNARTNIRKTNYTFKLKSLSFSYHCASCDTTAVGELKDDKIAEARLSICKECPFYLKPTSQCSKCGCVMPLKTKLEAAACPEGKW